MSSGDNIIWVDEWRYIGVYIVRSRVFKWSLDKAKKSFYRAANLLFVKIGRKSFLNFELPSVRLENMLQNLNRNCYIHRTYSVNCRSILWLFVWLQQGAGFEPIQQHGNTLASHYLQRDLFRGYPSDFTKYWIGGQTKRYLCLVKRELEHTWTYNIHSELPQFVHPHSIINRRHTVQTALLLGPILTQHNNTIYLR